MRTTILATVLAISLAATPVSAQNLSSGCIDGLLSSVSWENTSSAPSGSSDGSGTGVEDGTGAEKPIEDPAKGGTWIENFDNHDGWTLHTNVLHSGEKRWEGWNFFTIRDWTWAVGTEKRHYFTRGAERSPSQRASIIGLCPGKR